MTPTELVNAALQAGSIEEVSDEGQVTLRLPSGDTDVVWIPLEHVIRIRNASGRPAPPRSVC